MSNRLDMPKLWVPGQHLDHEYPTPDDAELGELWEEYSGQSARSTKGVYGVYNAPRDPVAVASVDLCEVVRETAFNLYDVTGHERRRQHTYAAGTWFDREVAGLEYELNTVTSIIRVMMNAGHVEPVEGIEEIRETLVSWRENDVYVVANTATLPGCEAGTITHTLTRDLHGCFDALILPRNWDNEGTVSKAAALSILASEVKLDLDSIPLIHIDDAQRHINAFQNDFLEHPQARFFVPHAVGTYPNADPWRPQTALDAFRAADEYFKEVGVIK